MISTRKILSFLILGTLVFEISRFYSFVEDYSSWQYADWLINYEGGLVRRGFIGEILYLIHKLLLIDLDKIIFSFVSLIYIFISYFLFKSLKYIENSYENILIFLSPGFFIYPVMNSGIIGRKDILFIFFISFFTFFEKKISNKYFFSALIISIIILCLSHSGFIFYSPYLIFLYILIKLNRNLKIKKIEMLSISITILFLVMFVLYFNGSEALIENICSSVKNFVSKNCGKSDQLYWLKSNIDNRLFEKINMGKSFIINYFLIYFLSIVLVFFFISIRFIYSNFKVNIYNLKFITPFFVLILLFLFTLPVYLLGRDWGRYIYISYSSSFFIYIYCLKENILFFKKYKTLLMQKINNISFVLFVILYSFFWTFPFYDASSFKMILKKPIYSFLKNIN